jgi:crotonobetaine/carnitine-CoA ligase
MNCHNSYVTAALEFARNHVRMRQDDVLYTSLPLFHVNAQSLTTLGSVVSGRPMVLAPRFSASRFFAELSAHRATVFNYIGAMLTMLFKQPPDPGDADNAVRLAVGGAAPAELWRDFEQRFGLSVLEIYGLTETATFCCGSPPDDIRPGRIGVPVSWAEVRVVDEHDEELAADQAGEIVIRAKRPDTLFQGYYKRQDATAEAMRGGWFHSGDRGSRDADGYFAFIDRLKDSIRRRGENISSYEVERVVNSHPEVAESAAYGVPSELGEDEVMVTVVVADGGLDLDGLIAFCQERMAKFMVPRYVRVQEALPKTATQRVQKFELRKLGVEGAWDRLASADQIPRR